MSDVDDEIRAFMLVLGSNVRRLMEKKGHTHATLAEAAGVSMRTVGLVLRPDERLATTSSPTIDTLCKISEALGIEPWELLA